MQQHHQNVTRAATINTPNHLRGHHLVGMHGNTNTTNMGPSVLNIPKVPQQPAHHIPQNVPSTSKNPSVLSTTTNSSNTHHSRLQHHHNNHQANNGRSSSQMHKPSRQQQQPSNNNNKSNNHPYKLGANLAISNQYKHPTNQQLGYNHINAPNQINHMGVVPQQQRNVIYHNTNPPQQQTQNLHPHLPGLQPPPPPPPSQHMKNPQQHPHQHQQQQPYNAPSTPSKHIAKQHHQQTSRVSHSSSSTSPITTNPSKPPFNQNSHHFYSSNQKFNKNKTQQHQQQHHYQNHQNYQNNNLNSNQNPPPYLKNAPKAILQNSNRICKTLPKSSQPELGDVSSTTSPTTLSFNDKNNSKDQSNSSSTASSISSSKTPDEQQMHSSKVLVTTAPQINGGSQSIECGTDAGGGGGGGSDDKENNPLCSKSNSLDYESNSDETSNNKHNINNNNNNNNNNNSNDINTKDNNNDNNFSNNTNNILSNEDLSATKNSKEKTPMCLVNELARYNKIGHQYRLTNEKGPAHCKRFTVTLKLGEEEYTAEGYKIKKAQHLAAAEAIEKTKYKHPIPKATRRNEDGHLGKVNITPTVELNALAMKLGQQTYYLFDPRQMPNGEPHHSPPDGIVPFVGQHPHLMPPPPPPHQIIDPMFIRRNGGNSFVPGPNGPLNHPRFIPNGLQRNGGYNQKYPQRYSMQMSHMPQPGPGGVPMPPPFNPTSCKITLIVGKQRFVGLGRNLQQAKHDAAAKALQVLKNQMNEEANNDLNNSYQDSDNKSPISMVHEIGLKRDMPVHFKVLREEGPAHMKNFITACIVGNIVTEGEGNGKKISKKRAADKMLEELKKLPPLTPTKSPVKRIKVKTPGKAGTPGGVKGGRKRGHSNSIKEKANEENEDENPVSKLIQIQQSRREKEPVFELISKNANEKSRRREFIMEVTVQGMVARGTGSSKKLAKRNAALNLLIAMGLEKENDEQGDYLDLNSSNIDSNSSMNINNISASSTHPSTSGVSDVSDASVPKSLLADLEVPVVSTTAGEVEGILLIRHNKKNAAKKKEQNSGTKQVTEEKRSNAADDVQNVPNSLKELNTTQPDNSNNRSSDALKCDDTRDGSAHETKDSGDSTVNCVNQANGVHMKDQLLYLAKLLGFTVNFSDYPKGNHNEFLSIVTLSTEPPQICHGVGTNAEESQNDAARNALKILSQLGLNCAK